MPAQDRMAPKRRWAQLLVGVLTALVLLPVPAMALTFTSGWSATTSVSGGPKPPTPTFADVTDVAHQRDDVTVDMGTYNGSTALATSSITLSRNFSITQNGGQNLFGEADYASFLANAGFTADFKIRSNSGDRDPIIFNVSNTTAANNLYSGSKSGTLMLAQGDYTIILNVTYKTNNKIGSWKMKSKHHFEAMGL